MWHLIGNRVLHVRGENKLSVCIMIGKGGCQHPSGSPEVSLFCFILCNVYNTLIPTPLLLFLVIISSLLMYTCMWHIYIYIYIYCEPSFYSLHAERKTKDPIRRDGWSLMEKN